ncbi:MAG: hypothetical protein KC493_05925 [Bacteriovoracaceae bacterium]|nr:hypothetical protein [Bacteriovoracaceae bacterium]
MKTLIGLIFLCISFQAASSLNLEARFLVDGEPQFEMNAGQQTNWSFSFLNPSRGMNHRMFMKMHAKEMHMIIIRDDYSHVAHVHPYLDKQTGIFSLDLNTTSVPDFDNQGVIDAVPVGGRYFVFTEVMPMGGDTEKPMLMNRFEVISNGNTPDPIIEDHPEGKDGIDLFFDENGQRGASGDQFKVTFSYEQFDFCDRWLPKFYFEWFERNVDGDYIRAKNFERWLDMGGHSILLDTDKSILKEKLFYHLHAFLPMSTDGEFVFPYHDHKNALPEGNYKIWGQFKHHGKIFTVPVPFKYTVPEDFPVDLNKCK